MAPEAPRSDPAKRFLSRAVAKNKPSTSDRGVAPRCEAQWDALDCSRVASDIVTVRECVGIAFSFAEKFEQSVFLRWDTRAVSLSCWCHCHPLAAASFGGGIMIGQWLRWRVRRVRWQMTRQWLVAAEADDAGTTSRRSRKRTYIHFITGSGSRRR